MFDVQHSSDDSENSLNSSFSRSSLPECGWEFQKKHIFVMSSAGKPIFSRYGDEQDLVATFGLMQAMISVVEDSGDHIQCMKAGDRTIVFFIKKTLYFVSISSTNEPEIILYQQLQFLYSQILLALTSKVHDVLTSNPSCDLRQLLGADTGRLMQAACASLITPPNIAFECVQSFTCRRSLREELQLPLQTCVLASNAALGMVLFNESLVGFQANPGSSLQLATADVVLLTHFVSHSSSLQTQDQHWLPLCLPAFNERGFLQAYVSSLRAEGGPALTLVLLAASADPEEFTALHRQGGLLGETLRQARPGGSCLERLGLLTSLQTRTVERLQQGQGAAHLLFKWRPCHPADRAPLPAQFVTAGGPEKLGLGTEAARDRLWSHYQRLAVRTRRGASGPESAFFAPDPTAACLLLPTNPNPSPGPAGGALARWTDKGEPSAGPGMAVELERVRWDPLQACSQPAADHALAYTVLADGLILVALASLESELFVTFAGQMTPLEACTRADHLSRAIRLELRDLFVT